jgi:hypothetical protein
MLGVVLTSTLIATAMPAHTASAATAAKPADARRAQAATNLFVNGDFANGLTGWTPRAAPQINSQSVVGGHLRINPTGAVSQQIAVTPNVVHTLTAYLRINQTFELSNETFQGASILVGPGTLANPGTAFASSGAYTTTNFGWLDLYVVFTPTVSTIVVQAGIFGRVFFGDDVTTQMSTDWDNFTLTTSNTLFADRPTSPPPVLCTNTTNLISNGDFSGPILNGDSGWRTFVYTDGLITTPVSVTNGAAQFNPDGWIAQRVPTTAGKTYYVSLKSTIAQVITAPVNSYLLMNISTDAGAQVQLGIFRNEVGPQQRSYFTFTAPLAQTGVIVNILTNSGFEMRGSVDDVVVSECPIAYNQTPIILGRLKVYLPLAGN